MIPDRGFLDETEDDTTGLNYLNARYQDPVLGMFISVDPLVSMTREPYIYAGGNPARYSDPAGLEKGANGEAQAACPPSGCKAHQYGNFDNSGWLSDYYKTGGRVGQSCVAEKTCIQDAIVGVGLAAVLFVAIATGPLIVEAGGLSEAIGAL